jgi:hypothetical protein
MFWASADNNGCHFVHHYYWGTSQHQLNIEVDEQRPQKMNAQGRPPLGWCGFIESMPLEGAAAPSPWWWCFLVVCVVVDGLVTSQAHCM